MSVRVLERLSEDRKFHLFILSGSVFLFLLTLAKTDIGSPEPTVYWYASELYWTFWVGLALAVSSILLSVKQDDRYLALVSALVPLFYLYTLPPLVHDMLPVFDVYHVIPQVSSIMRTGAWDTQLTLFPGSHIYQASSVMVMGTEIMTYAMLFPTMLAFSVILSVFSIAKRISLKWASLAPLTFLALNWFMEYHLARQGFTVMLWAAFWMALYLYVDLRDYRLGLLAGILLFLIPISHPGMIAIVGFNFLALAAVTLLSFKKKVRWKYLYPVLPLMIVLGASFFLLYSFFPPVNEYITAEYENVLEGSFEFVVGGPASPSSQYAFVNRLRMFAGIIQSLLGLLGFYVLYRTSAKRALLLGGWFFSCYLWLIRPFTLSTPGITIERAFLTALIPASVLIVALLEHFPYRDIRLRRMAHVAVVVLIVSSMFMIPVTKNSIDSVETPSTPSYRAGRFTQEKMSGRVHVTDTHLGMFRYLQSAHPARVRFTYQGTSPPNGSYGYQIPRTDSYYTPMLFTDYFNNYIQVRYGKSGAVDRLERYEGGLSIRSQRIYDSGGSRLYTAP